MKDTEKIIKALESFPSKATVLYDSANNETVTFQDVVTYIRRLQIENERLNDMEFTQEHCDLYKENEWLKDTLRQYMNGEIVNENIFCQQVEDMKQLRKYIVGKFANMAKERARWMRDNSGDYTAVDIDDIDEICKKILEGADNGK